MDQFRFKASVGHGGGNFERQPMWRRVNGPGGRPTLVKDPPNFPVQEGTILLDPNREYRLKIHGMSDVFTETKDWGNGPKESNKLKFEFVVCNSARWDGTVLTGFYAFPQDWGDERSQMAELAMALIGHRLGDEEDINFAEHFLNETKFKAFVVHKVGQQSKKPYNKIDRHSPIVTEPEDDFIPDGSVGSSYVGPASSYVAPAAAPSYDADGVPDDFVPDSVDVDEIPF